MNSRPFLRTLLALAIPALSHAGDERQVEIAKQGGFVPKIQPASDEAANAIKGFKLAPGLALDLWAAEPLLANPVAFATDEKGRWFVAETFRLHAGVSDIRAHMNWLEDELASNNLDSFLAILKGDPKVEFEKNAKNSERVQLIWDSKGVGRADSSSIFAEGFNGPLDGLASGVLARKGAVYFTSIPDLWMLKDTKGHNTADIKTSLAKGFGVRTAFLGHDLHGLRMGPDGRIYFTVGDRGANATAVDGSSVKNTETGAVYRCNPDGSKLEIFALGLRNPQELAFDEFGNLFTGDHNSDAGDPARWVYVQQNSDSGWRIGWQFLTKPDARGPWLSERLCYPAFPGQSAHHLPPVAILGNGPSGLTYNPGTGLSPEWHGYFFLANFSGSPSNSGVFAVQAVPKGAGFEMSAPKKPVWNLLATDVEFGVDGKLYVLDWVNGWGMNGKGRIYRSTTENTANANLQKEVQLLLAQGFTSLPEPRLVELLNHPDMRVRMESQFELAERHAIPSLQKATLAGNPQFTRIHGIWGLGQTARASKSNASALLPSLSDPDDEIRAQAARTLGDIPDNTSVGALVPLLNDASPRVRSFAAIALGNLHAKTATPALLEALAKTSSDDPALRHALMSGLAGANDPETLAKAADRREASVRIGAAVALRRLKHPSIQSFLKDKDASVAAEAARGVHDESITDAMPALADLLANTPTLASLPNGSKLAPAPKDAILRRAINAAFRTGRSVDASRLVAAALQPDLENVHRVSALQSLGTWENPPKLDRVMGLHRPLPQRSPAPAIEALSAKAAALLSPSLPAPVLTEAIALVAKFGPSLPIPAGALSAIVSNPKIDAEARAAALRAMASRNDPALIASVDFAAIDASEVLRKAATKLRADLKLPGGGTPALAKILEIGTTGEKQNAIQSLATLTDARAAELLEQKLDVLIQGKLPQELHLELLEAVVKRTEPTLQTKFATYKASLAAADPLADFRQSLAGGNAAEGRRVFMEKAEASCIRCHKVKNDGAEVGPNLTDVGKRQTREYLLESIVNPNAKIAVGFETVIVTARDGAIHAGILKSETADTLTLMPPTGTPLNLKKTEIQKRESGPSGMPPLGAVLTRRELRDLVEYLTTLR